GEATSQPAATQAAPAPPPVQTSVDHSTLTEIDISKIAVDANVGTDLAKEPEKTFEHGPIVTSVRQRLSGEMTTLLHPALPAKAVAVVKRGTRATEDHVEMWNTGTWTARKAVTLSRGGQSSDHYQLSPDGN